MAWWNWGKKEVKSRVDTSHTLEVNDSLGRLLRFGFEEAATPHSALRLYKKSTAVSIPVGRIVTAFKSLNPVIQNMETDEITRSHEMLKRLRHPSPHYHETLFKEFLAVTKLVTGYVGVAAMGNIRHPPVEIRPVSSAVLNPYEGPDGIVQAYEVTARSMGGQYVKTSLGPQRRLVYKRDNMTELTVIRSFNVSEDSSLICGMSPLLAASSEVRQHISGNTHNLSMLDNGGRISMVFHFNEDIDSSVFDELKARINEEYGGPTRAGSIAVTSGSNLEIKELSKSNKDMDFVKLMELALRACANQYGVPLPILSNDAATFNNFAAAQVALYDNAVFPLADDIYGSIGNWLLPRWGLDPEVYRLTYDPFSIPAIRSRVLAEVKERSSLKLETDNELRGLLGQEPIENGDILLKDANLIPLEDIVNPPETPTYPAPVPAKPPVTEGDSADIPDDVQNPDDDKEVKPDG